MNVTITPGKPSRRRFATFSIAMLSLVVAGCSPVVAQPTDEPPGGSPVGGQTTAETAGDTDTAGDSDAASAKTGEAVATLAGGCFWCTEAVFERMEGVNDVVSGYIGGHIPNPTYEMVCSKRSGHAEAVEIYYDPSKVTFEELLEVFFGTHDPTTLNQQGADKGPQYRSSVFFHDTEQKRIADDYIEQLNKSGSFRRPLVTKLEKATKFYPAEEYHQDYFARNPNAGYCQAVVRTKVEKFDKYFKDKAKKN